MLARSLHCITRDSKKKGHIVRPLNDMDLYLVAISGHYKSLWAWLCLILEDSDAMWQARGRALRTEDFARRFTGCTIGALILQVSDCPSVLEEFRLSSTAIGIHPRAPCNRTSHVLVQHLIVPFFIWSSESSPTTMICMLLPLDSRSRYPYPGPRCLRQCS